MFDDNSDDGNRLPRVKPFQIIFLIVGLVFLLIDQLLDIYVCLDFWRDGHMWFFLFSLILYLLPSLIISAMSIFMHHSAFLTKKNDKIPPNVWKVKVFWTTIRHFPNLCLIWRYVDILRKYAKNKHLQNSTNECKENNETLEQFLKEFYTKGRDTFFLRFVEAYLECGPQLVLRLYSLAERIQMDTLFPGQMHAIVIFSWISMAWSSANYERWRLYCMKDANCINVTETVYYFVFYAFTLASRLYSMAMFASIYEHFFFVYCGIHWFVMTVFILVVKVKNKWDYKERTENVFFSIVLGFTCLFCYIDATEGPTWWLRCQKNSGDQHQWSYQSYQSVSAHCFVIYHVIIYLETLVITIIIWCNYQVAPVLVNYASIDAVLIVVFFAIGIMVKIFIYRVVHPPVTEEQRLSESQDQLLSQCKVPDY